MKHFGSEIMKKLQNRFSRLYGEAQAERCMRRFEMIIGRYGVGEGYPRPALPSTEKDVILITYGDIVKSQGERPLETLKRFASQHLKDSFNTIHLLPFFPYSSDDGFSVTDYRTVNPLLGDWKDIEEISKDFKLMFDLVLNHVSRQSSWFANYVGGVMPYLRYFIETDPNADLSTVVRPRSNPLLTKVGMCDGERHLWTTFSDDQIDLNYGNPDVLFEFLDILLYYISRGASYLRLDAIAYLWKKIGTPCIHLDETHEIVKLMRNLIEIVEPGVRLVTETNVPSAENISYLGVGDEAHMIYQFPLPPLLLHALHSGTSRYLNAWLMSLPELPRGCSYLNFTASHDGIGVRPLESLMPEEEINRLLERITQRGGFVSKKKNSDGTESPYEMNIAYIDALMEPGSSGAAAGISRFLCSQSIAMSLKGVPGIYFNSLVAARNDRDNVEKTGMARAINRHKWEIKTLEHIISNKRTVHARVFKKYIKLLKIRSNHPAFSPEGKQTIMEISDVLFALQRISPDGNETIYCVSNLSGNDAYINAYSLIRDKAASPLEDIIGGTVFESSISKIRLEPYQTVWIKSQKNQ